MVRDDIAGAVLAALGGKGNVLSNTVCMTRLRVTVANPQAVDYERLNDVPTVLGTATRGANGIEVVFGPRVIQEVYHAFVRLTGLSTSVDALFPMSRSSSNLQVTINARHQVAPRTRRVEPLTPKVEPRHIDAESLFADSELSLLSDIYSSMADDGPAPREKEHKHAPQLLVLNGPNLNLLGLEGDDDAPDFSAMLEFCRECADDVGFSRCVTFQSNHVGDLVDHIQDAFGVYDAIVVNAGSEGPIESLVEALRVIGIPYSFIASSVRDIEADGLACYERAITDLADRLGLSSTW